MPADRSKLPQAFWDAVERQGLRPAAVLRQARLPATLHHDRAAVIGTEQLFAIWRAIESLSQDAGFGIRMASDTDTTRHQLAFLAASYAADYRDALMRVARFKRLCSPDEVRFTQDGNRVAISTAWPPGTAPEPALSVDASFAMLIELGRRGTGERLVPVSLALERPDPGVRVHTDYFGCTVRFGAKHNQLVLGAADLERPFPGHNPELLDLLTPALAAALGEIKGQDGIGTRVKIALKRMLASGRPDIDAVAGDLGMSVRTLQRQITAEGGTFRSLLAEARGELGKLLLADPALNVDEVAFLLGYQDVNSFYRAFRAWEGTTPARWRRSLVEKGV